MTELDPLLKTVYESFTFTLMDERSVPQLKALLHPYKGLTFELDGSKITNLATFMEECNNALPHTTGLSGLCKADAFIDWIWSELSLLRHEEGINSAILLWKDFASMNDSSKLSELLKIVEVMNGVANQLHPVHLKLKVCLIGSGPNFS